MILRPVVWGTQYLSYLTMTPLTEEPHPHRAEFKYVVLLTLTCFVIITPYVSLSIAEPPVT